MPEDNEVPFPSLHQHGLAAGGFLAKRKFVIPIGREAIPDIDIGVAVVVTRIRCNLACGPAATAATDRIAQAMRPGIVCVEGESLGKSSRKNCLQSIVVAGRPRRVRLDLLNIWKRRSSQQGWRWRWPLRGVIRIRTIGFGNVDEGLEELVPSQFPNAPYRDDIGADLPLHRQVELLYISGVEILGQIG